MLVEELQDGCFKCMVIFDMWIELFKLFWVSMLPEAFHLVFAQKNIWVVRDVV